MAVSLLCLHDKVAACHASCCTIHCTESFQLSETAMTLRRGMPVLSFIYSEAAQVCQ